MHVWPWKALRRKSILFSSLSYKLVTLSVTGCGPYLKMSRNAWISSSDSSHHSLIFPENYHSTPYKQAYPCSKLYYSIKRILIKTLNFVLLKFPVGFQSSKTSANCWPIYEWSEFVVKPFPNGLYSYKITEKQWNCSCVYIKIQCVMWPSTCSQCRRVTVKCVFYMTAIWAHL